MEAKSLQFLQSLCDSFGPSGFEREAARIVKAYVTGISEKIEVQSDRLGSLLFRKMGCQGGPVVLLPGHIDEVGFIVSGISKEGFLSFNPIGGWYDQVLLGQRVKVRTKTCGDLLGIIAATPPHVLPAQERDKVVKKEKMFIDIGCSNEKEATHMGVRIGDPIVPDSTFSTTTKTTYVEDRSAGETTLAVGKGFDDRIGAFIAAEVIRRLIQEEISHPNTLVGAATVMEEVGLRGARTTAHLVNPDVCLTLEVDISGDIPGIEKTKAPTKMGAGPSILTFDASMIPNQGLKELVIETAEESGIPYQLSQMAFGGTDGGVVHTSNAGCPSIVLGVPTRHIHSHAGILSLDDVEHCIQLVMAVIQRLDADTVAAFTAI